MAEHPPVGDPPRSASLSGRAALLIASNTFKYAVGIGVHVTLARHLSRHDYGTYQQLLLVGSVTVGVMTLGLPTSVYYFLHRFEKADRHLVIVQTLVLLFAAGAVAAMGVLLAGPLLARAMSNPALFGLIPLYAVYLLFFIASEAVVHILIGQDAYRTAAALEVVEAAVRAGLLVIPILLTGSLRVLVAAVAAYAVLRFVFFSFVLRGSFLGFRPGDSRRAFVGEQFRFGIPLALTQIVALLGGVIDRTIIALSFGPEQYAIYAVGAIELPLDTILQGSVANVVRATVPPLVRGERLDEIARILRAAVRKLSLAVVPIFLLLLTFSREIILLAFTPRYAGSVDIFRIYLFLVPLHIFVLSSIPQAFGRTRLNLGVAVVGIAAKAALSIALLRMISYYGPAVATVLTGYVTSGVFFLIVVRLLRTRPAALLPLGALGRVSLCSVAAGVCARGLFHLTGGGLAGLAFGITLYTLVFAGTALATGIIQDEERALARRLFARVFTGRNARS